MKRSNRIYNVQAIITAVFMIASLLWLTLSLPVVNSAQQKQIGSVKSNAGKDKHQDDNDCYNPFANTTEEKAPSTNLSEEYLHGHTLQSNSSVTYNLVHFCHHVYNVYVAFHGELLSPPPEV